MSHVDDGFRSLTLKRFPQTDDVNPASGVGGGR